MMAGEVDRLMDGVRIGLIMEWLMGFALQWSREYRMHDRMVLMARATVVVLDLRVDVDPGHHDQPEGDPEEQGGAGPA